MFYIKSDEINYKIEAALKGNAKVSNELSQYFEYFCQTDRKYYLYVHLESVIISLLLS